MVTLYDSFPEHVDKKRPLFARVDGLFVPLYLIKFERRGKSGAIVSFEDIDTERRMSEFINMELYTSDNDQAYNPDDEEFTLDELVGYKVELIVDNSTIIGKITQFIDSDYNPLFEICIDNDTHLIPAVEEFILSIDFEGGSITIAPPNGLLDL